MQRLIEDEELRDSLRNAFEAARGAYGRATGNGKSPVKAVTSDKKVQKDLREAAESLRDASEQLRAPKKRKKHRLGRLILLGMVGAAVALILSEDARKTVLDALFGAEEEFEYTQHHQHQRLLTAAGELARTLHRLSMEAATKERELSGEKAQRIVDAMRVSVAKRGAAGSTFEQVAARGRGQPRPPPLLLRDQGAAAGRGRPPRRRDPRRPPRRARWPRRRRVDDVLDVLALQPHRPDRERAGLLPAPLRAVQRRPPQPRHPARGRPALRAHPLPRRRGARGQGERGRAQASATTPRRSSPSSSRSATASPCRRSPTPSATSSAAPRRRRRLGPLPAGLRVVPSSRTPGVRAE